MKLTILFDNLPYKEGLKTSWGFACLIEKEETTLFDAGGDGDILLYNMSKMGVDPKNIAKVIISHDHWDHTGGLSGFLKQASNPSVYILKSFSKSIKREIKKQGAKKMEVKEPGKLYDEVYTTGEIGTWLKEQSFIVKSSQGLVVIAGCAHSGIVNIVAKVRKMFKEEIYLVMGGFHLGGYLKRDISDIILHLKDFGVKKVGPSHCTGEREIAFFKQKYGKNFLKIGVGRVIEI